MTQVKKRRAVNKICLGSYGPHTNPAPGVIRCAKEHGVIAVFLQGPQVVAYKIGDAETAIGRFPHALAGVYTAAVTQEEITEDLTALVSSRSAKKSPAVAGLPGQQERED